MSFGDAQKVLVDGHWGYRFPHICCVDCAIARWLEMIDARECYQRHGMSQILPDLKTTKGV